MDTRDKDWKFTEHKIGFTVTDLGVVNTGRVWRWQVAGREIVSQSGLRGWLRPTVKDRPMVELLEERITAARRATQSIGFPQ
jgi:hypothetical protein